MLKRALLFVGAGIVVLIALVFLIGSLLPQDHTAASYITLSQPPDSVWSAVRDFGAYPSWWPYARAMERAPDRGGHEVWVQTDAQGGRIPLGLVEVDPPRRMVTRIADEDLPFGGTWTYLIEAIPDGTRVTVTEDGQVYSALFRFVGRFILGQHRTLESYLSALSKRFGEEPQITRIETTGTVE